MRSTAGLHPTLGDTWAASAAPEGAPAEGAPAGGAGAALSWLGHPVTLLAVAVLVVNDHLLKDLTPGALTGKLSDVAGLAAAPSLLAALLGLLVPRLAGSAGSRAADRVAAAAGAATGLGFAAVKATEHGARVASQVWTALAGPSRVLADPTDLLALPALGVAWWAWRRVRHRPVNAAAVRQVRMAVVLPVAVLAVAATSTAQPEDATSVGVWRGLIIPQITGGDYDMVLASADGGASWRRLVEEEEQAFRAETGGPLPPRTSACVPGDPAHCYRTVPGRLGVEESRDGGATWTTAWALSPGRERFLRRSLDDTFLWPGGVQLASAAVVVQARDSGHVVMVANRWDGLLRKDPAGVWRRIGFPVHPYPALGQMKPPAPLVDRGAHLRREYTAGIAVGWLVLAVGVLLAGRGPRSTKLPALAYAGTALGPILLLLALLDMITVLPLLELGAALLLIPGLAPFLVPAGASGGTRALAWGLAGVALLTAGLVVLPFVGWTVGAPDDYAAAAKVAAGTGVLGLAAGAILGWLIRRRAGPVGPPLTAGRKSASAAP